MNNTDEELQKPDSWDWEHAETRPGRKLVLDTEGDAMNTETEHRPKLEASTMPHCPICGEWKNSWYAHDTCSPECARTAAIVQAIDRWQAYVLRGVLQYSGP